MKDQKTISIPASDFRQGLKMAKHCVMKNETRINLKTFHIVSAKGKGLIETTDGHRAGRYRFKTTGKGFDIMLPLDDFKAYMTECPKAGDFTIYTPDPIGKFPNMDAVWPDGREQTVMVDRGEFLDAIRATCKVSKERIKPIRFAMRGDLLSLTTEIYDGETPEFDFAMEVKRSTGEDYFMGFNAKYILEFLQATPRGGTIAVELNGPLKPAVFSHDESPQYREVIMPLRIEWGEGVWPVKVSPAIPAPVPEKRPDLIPQPEIPSPGMAARERWKGLDRPPFVNPFALWCGVCQSRHMSPVCTAQPVQDTAQDGKSIPALSMAVYSEKAFIITGNTMEHRTRILKAVPKASGIWHRKAEGWIFSRKHMAKFEKKLKDLLAA